MDHQGKELAEGLYWMAEKLAWGYDGTAPDPAEAFKLYRQAAGLGFSDAFIRLGQLQERGRGTPQDPKAAVKKYQEAAKAGNFLAFHYLAKLLSRGGQSEHAHVLWNRFFKDLAAHPKANFLTASTHFS